MFSKVERHSKIKEEKGQQQLASRYVLLFLQEEKLNLDARSFAKFVYKHIDGFFVENVRIK